MNRNIKTRNSSETQTIQYFNSTQIIKVKENDCLDIFINKRKNIFFEFDRE